MICIQYCSYCEYDHLLPWPDVIAQRLHLPVGILRQRLTDTTPVHRSMVCLSMSKRIERAHIAGKSIQIWLPRLMY